jgi:hypothetical protein
LWAGAASFCPTGTRTSNTDTLPLESSPVRRNRIPSGPILMVSSEALTLVADSGRSADGIGEVASSAALDAAFAVYADGQLPTRPLPARVGPSFRYDGFTAKCHIKSTGEAPVVILSRTRRNRSTDRPCPCRQCQRSVLSGHGQSTLHLIPQDSQPVAIEFPVYAPADPWPSRNGSQ